MEPAAWLEPVPGQPAYFRLKPPPPPQQQQLKEKAGSSSSSRSSSSSSFVPYFEIGAEHFTAFPLFSSLPAHDSNQPNQLQPGPLLLLYSSRL
eukprot:COSAG06_NODE_6733_length_2803_cov_19.880547_2_plen_93_part_00